jgi:L-proline amide hydrolase
MNAITHIDMLQPTGTCLGEISIARNALFQPASTGNAPFRGHHTWYRVTAPTTADPGRVPLVVLHGGPGATHDYLLTMTALASDGRSVVHYDQLGSGRSTHLPDADPTFWTVGLFVDELANLLQQLGVADRFHLLGQSWGGMLAAEFALTRPPGMRSLVICDSPASIALWLAAAEDLRRALPPDVEAVLRQHESAETTDSLEYKQAMQVFYDRHVCRVVPNPPEVAATFAAMDANPTVYRTMNGPSEFHVVGTMKDWSIVDRVHLIDIPTLVVAGAHDEAAPATWAPFVERIPDCASHVFPASSHMPHVEEPDAFAAVVGEFLRRHDD